MEGNLLKLFIVVTTLVYGFYALATGIATPLHHAMIVCCLFCLAVIIFDISRSRTKAKQKDDSEYYYKFDESGKSYRLKDKKKKK